MLEFHQVSLQRAGDGERSSIVHDCSAQLPEGHFCGIIGPAGAGKTALLEGIGGLLALHSGSITWQERPAAPREVCLITRRDAACEGLTVRQNIEAAFRLRAMPAGAKSQHDEVEALLATAGLGEVADQRFDQVDLACKRRALLGAALTGQPPVLLCDGLSDDLDPREEIALLKTLKQLAEDKHHLVIAATQSVRHLSLYDSALVLYAGMIAYHGPSPLLPHYFNIDHAEDLFPTLAGRSPGDWYRSWLKHRGPYAERVAAANSLVKSEQARIGELFSGFRAPGSLRKDSGVLCELPPTPSALPGVFTQTGVLAARHWREFSRNAIGSAGRIALSVGAPALVASVLKNSSAPRPEWLAGLLLVLGAANGTREFERKKPALKAEMRAGVRPIALLLSTMLFLGIIIVAQALWTAMITREFGASAGTIIVESLWFALGIGAMTSLALALSALARSADRAALYATYFVVINALVYLVAGPLAWTLFGALAQGALHLGLMSGIQKIAGALIVVKLHLAAGLLAAWLGLRQMRV